MEIIPEKKKRGRKAKPKEEDSPTINKENIHPKKRRRKPTRKKDVDNLPKQENLVPSKINIILHLKCDKNDLTNNNSELLENFQFSESKLNEINYTPIDNESHKSILNNDSSNTNSSNPNSSNTNSSNTDSTNNDINNENNTINVNNMKTIWKKLDNLSNNLHSNNISDKKSSCFFCTYEFDNNAIYIPKYELNGIYHVYGCFCSPECACGFLMNEQQIDNTTRFERYYLLNYLYCKIYSYTKNIKPAPSPFYMLDKYYGNLSIQEYRKLLKNERLLLIVDKPLLRILPELHEDTDDFLLNNKGVNSILSNKYIVNKNNREKTKNEIMNKQFNLH